MAKFQKANPQQARLKVSVYGPPGSGKTFTTLLMAEGLAKVRGKRIAYVDTERGTDFYAQKVEKRKVHPEAFDFDALYTKSIADVTEAIKSLDPNEHGIVVLDSISHLWTSAMDAFTGKLTKIGSIPMHAWGQIKKPYKDLVNYLIGSPLDVFILGRQKNIFETDAESDEMKKIGVGMRAEGETAYEPHICLRMESRQDPNNTTRSAYLCYVEKDRTGVLAGSMIANPTFATVQPLLPLLGEVQAPAEDDDERIAKDAELMAKEDDKAHAREAKSLERFNELQVKLIGAGDIVTLAAAWQQEVVKGRRGLTTEHFAALTEIKESRKAKLLSEGGL